MSAEGAPAGTAEEFEEPAEPVGVAAPVADVGGALPPEILASRLWTVF